MLGPRRRPHWLGLCRRPPRRSFNFFYCLARSNGSPTDWHPWLLLSWLTTYDLSSYAFVVVATNLATPFPLSLLHPSLQHFVQCSRLKSSMPFKCDLVLQYIPLSKQPFIMQPQIENEDVTWSPQYNMTITRTNKWRALSLQEVELDSWFLILQIPI